MKCRRCLVSVSRSRGGRRISPEVMVPHNVSRGRRRTGEAEGERWRPHYIGEAPREGGGGGEEGMSQSRS